LSRSGRLFCCGLEPCSLIFLCLFHLIELPFISQVVKKEDIFYAVEEERIDTLSATVAEETCLDTADVKDVARSNVDLEAAISSSAIDIENDDMERDRECLLKLPIKTETGEHRHVDGECAICLLEYEPGDSVVWATRKVCPHAYHDDCILVWLSKGKKRCPICRNFFVPGSSIDNKKVITHDEDDEEAYISGSMLYEDAESDEDPLGAVREEEVDEEPVSLDGGSQRDATNRMLYRRLSSEVLS